MRTLLLAASLILPALGGSAAQAQPAASSTLPDEAQGPWDPPTRLAAQREAMEKLAFMDGAWRGTAQAGSDSGALMQTERIGPLLDGTVKLVEGRTHDGAGKVRFNVFAVISYDPAKRAFVMSSYAMGYAGDYPLTVRADGFSWSHPAEPGVIMRYTATINGDQWHETGERVAGNEPPVKVLEMRLRRLSESAWPEGGAVPLR